MGILHWLFHNWHSILGDIGIVGALIFTGVEMRSEAKTRRVANLLTVTNNHRELWSATFDHPELLERVRDANASLANRGVTEPEEIFVVGVILHLASVFVAQKDNLIVKEDGLRRDVWDFFSRPIPAAVWEKMKVLYNDDFVLLSNPAGTGNKRDA